MPQLVLHTASELQSITTSTWFRELLMLCLSFERRIHVAYIALFMRDMARLLVAKCTLYCTVYIPASTPTLPATVGDVSLGPSPT